MSQSPLLLALLLAAGHCGQGGPEAMEATDAQPMPVVLSTDCGTEIDDQWAVMYLAIGPQFETLGFVGNHARNGLTGAMARDCILEVLETRLGMTEHPPVFAGADGPLAAPDRPSPNDGVRFLVETSRPFSPTDRLNVLIIGSHTDVALAILTDPSIVTRIRVVMMGFRAWPEGGDDWNVQNDLPGARVVLESGAPLVVGCGDVAKRDLSFTSEEAQALLEGTGRAGAWLAECFAAFPGRFEVGDRKVWPIWDDITVAYLLGHAQTTVYHRPRIADDLAFDHADPQGQLTWIERVDSARFWPGFVARLKAWEAR